MADTIIFDSANALTPIDGTKTLAQLNLSDTQNVSSFIGGKLRIAGVSNGYINDYVLPIGYSGLFPTVSFTVDAAALGTATAIATMRGQSDNARYFFSVSSAVKKKSCSQTKLSQKPDRANIDLNLVPTRTQTRSHDTQCLPRSHFRPRLSNDIRSQP